MNTRRLRFCWTHIWRQVGVPVLICIMIQARISVTAVRCYCTEKSCEPYGYCESQWCVVGIRKSTGKVIRSCGTDQAYMLRICRRDLGDWQDLCACGDELCNSYAYLRTQIRNNRFVTVGSGAEPNELPSYVRNSYEETKQLTVPPNAQPSLPRHPQHKPLPIVEEQVPHVQQPIAPPQPQVPPPPDEDAIMFTRMDSSKQSNRRHKQDLSHGHGHGPEGNKGIVFERNSLLVILLVVVPLGIGALSVLIVASNYYCHLC